MWVCARRLAAPELSKNSVNRFTRLRFIWQIALAGGLVSIFGSALVQFVLRSIDFPNRNARLFQSSDEVVWLSLAFLSGAVIGAGTAILWSRKDRAVGTSNRRWPKHGLLFGMLAGLANVLLLTIIHLSLLFAPVVYRGEMTLVTLIGLGSTYALIALVVFGIPATIIGGLTGIIIEVTLRSVQKGVTH